MLHYKPSILGYPYFLETPLFLLFFEFYHYLWKWSNLTTVIFFNWVVQPPPSWTFLDPKHFWSCFFPFGKNVGKGFLTVTPGQWKTACPPWMKQSFLEATVLVEGYIQSLGSELFNLKPELEHLWFESLKARYVFPEEGKIHWYDGMTCTWRGN